MQVTKCSEFRWKDGLFPPEIPKRVSSASAVLLEPRARLGAPPDVFSTRMLVSGGLPRMPWYKMLCSASFQGCNLRAEKP